MTSLDSRSLCRVVLIAPSTRIDLALPADVAIIDLLPTLLTLAGEAAAGPNQHDWTLTRIGHGELDGGATLHALAVSDGEVLRLAKRHERMSEPVFDDLIDSLAGARRERINTRSINPGLSAGVIIAAMLAAALTLLLRGASELDAYVAGGIAIAWICLAAAVANTGERVLATATAASAVPFAVVAGLLSVPEHVNDHLRWGVVLGACLALLCSVAAALVLGTGTVVFTATATMALLTAFSALGAEVTHAGPVRVVAATVVISLGTFSILPSWAMRLARLPRAAALMPSGEQADADDVTARARSAGDYLTGMQIGYAATISFGVLVLAVQATALSVALAATAAVTLALRTRAVADFGGRIALIGSVAASAVVAAVVVVVLRRDANGLGLVIVEVAIGLVVLSSAASMSRRPVSPQTDRLLDLVEAAAVLSVLPLAVGVMGLYGLARQF